ncbi:MAG: DVU0298 family protein [Caldimicrobium sp.]
MKFKIPRPPQCPFCKRVIAKPTFLPIGFSDYQAGVCECGAVYVVDETGFNRGAAFLEALIIACNGDWDLALSLLPDEDYQEIWLENYDPVSHTLPGEPLYEGRKIRGALCFLKLAEDLEQLKSKERLKSLTKEETSLLKEIKEEYKRRLSRKEIETMIKAESWRELLFYLLGESLNLHMLQKLLYHPEEGVRKRASILIGQACGILAGRTPEKVLDLIKRLLFASADSAASPWGALEAVGEIIRETGNRYEIFVKNLFGFLVYPEYLISTLYALSRIAEKSPHLIKKAPYLRLLSLFPKVSSLAQAIIIQIFRHINGKELLSYKEFLKQEEVNLFDYQQLDYTFISLTELWQEYKHTVQGS